MLKRFIVLLFTFILFVSFTPIQVEAATKTPVIKTANDLEKYLKKNFGTLKAKYATFDVSDSIKVIENEDEYTCFDLAIVIDWADIEDGYYKIQDSKKYTKEQKKWMDTLIKRYQKKIADIAMKAFPKKKIRGGFLDYGYEYPNIKEDYYEGAVFGWKNYEYLDDGLFPGYEDTKLSEFEWCSFNDIDDPFDNIGLY